jgi:hypothetical protein
VKSVDVFACHSGELHHQTKYSADRISTTPIAPTLNPVEVR